jgi:hypothetical protein
MLNRPEVFRRSSMLSRSIARLFASCYIFLRGVVGGTGLSFELESFFFIKAAWLSVSFEAS